MPPRKKRKAEAPPEQSEAFARFLQGELDRRQREDKLKYYKPYPKQAQFHGSKVRERLLIAANQVGKTWAGGFEAAMHATGRYPDDWKGWTFDKPTVSWIAGVTGEAVRDNAQRVLVGRPGQYGTAAIPKDAIVDLVPARGTPDLLDSIRVRHGGGGDVQAGTSMIGVKSYEKGREKWQGETLDWVWFDEEPPIDIYLEGLTRTNATGGMVWMTFTPLQGQTETVRRFLLERSPDRFHLFMTLDDADHFTPEERAKIVASYPEHEREARTKGVPVLGSGRIFPISDEQIACEARDFPDHFPHIGGMDFGWDHPFAAVELVWDREQDIGLCDQGTPGTKAITNRRRGNPETLGQGSFPGHGPVTDGARLWKALALLSPISIASKAWTCSTNTLNSRTSQ